MDLGVALGGKSKKEISFTTRDILYLSKFNNISVEAAFSKKVIKV